jgi:hypothetical protein
VTASTSAPARFWKILRWALTALALILLLAIVGLIVWAATPYGQLMPQVPAALADDSQISVTTRGWIAFVPNQSPRAGIILYPGGRIQAEAYAPLARLVAEAGYLAVIVHAPLNLAIFNPNAADAVLSNYSAIEHWVVGGHSLGAIAAAIYAASHPGQIDGLVLMGAPPADGALTQTALDVLSIYGSEDRLAPPESIRASANLLPPSAQFVEIVGGNHSQFGYYGFQSGDGTATISYEEQTEQVVSAINALLERVSGQ